MLVDALRLGPARRIVDLDLAAIRQRDVVAHARRGGNQVQLVLALQPLLDDLHVQQTQEPAAKAEPQRHRALRLKEERRIVQPQLFQSIAQQGVLVRIHGVEARRKPSA